MTIDHDIAVLERVPMLRALGRSALRLIALGAETRDVAPDETLFKPGERIDCAYVVQQGRFRLSPEPGRTGQGDEVGPGTMLGEYALIADSVRPPSATALDDAVVIRVSRSMFLKILEDDANAALRLRDYVAYRARQSVADILAIREALGPGED